ncbi:HEPN domain-containing protein [Nocardia sp. NPDC046763]|uniref:HEPN domain-containing protein n=1 Tax=Nocardia sp. NPDC046763 TaxID=3155256 RepID=UPI003400D2E2
MTRLIDDARSLGETGKGSPNGVALRAALIVLMTAWETYIEDVCLEAFDHMMSSVRDPTNLPHELRAKVAKAHKNPWALAGHAWREAARNEVSREVASLNTPNSSKVDELVCLSTGIQGALGQCAWANMSAEKLADYLDEFTQIRGEIVHKGHAPGDLDVKGVRLWCEWIVRLADRLDDVIWRHLGNLSNRDEDET